MMKENPEPEIKHDSYPNPPPSYAFYTPPQDQRQPHYELPAETLGFPPPPSTNQKHRLSELSGETIQRSELESPWQSPSLPNASSEDAIWSTPTSPAGRKRQSDQALGITSEDGNGREHSEIRVYPGV
ncbi:hypothetical protein K505DRAFT_372216 [Melanomma pulvis-pyrius CBS 109.77]|uniref:Uncharacterized protein n=1 Tax=Melanomma pulvis-pyrius CBS 109.77 TaxID=1314802 RepID=A0A6A6XQB9_9PLEO|nr:hypothetical protein K505DRAFT_372216 [Melanomma pulvis-pyrius CBS 109.77]